MKLESKAFKAGQKIPAKYTCDGDHTVPPLSFLDVPAAANALVLIMDDPDVPTFIREDNMYDHWIVYNLPPETQGVIEGEEPNGIQGEGTGGHQSYFGPCPPDREHRYFFKLYALDKMLDLSQGATKKEVEAAMQGHIIEKAELMGRYELQKK